MAWPTSASNEDGIEKPKDRHKSHESFAPRATRCPCLHDRLLVTFVLVTVARMVGYHCGHQKLVLEVHMPQVNCTWEEGGGLLLQLLLPGPAAMDSVRD